MQLTLRVGEPCGLGHQDLSLAWERARTAPRAALAETASQRPAIPACHFIDRFHEWSAVYVASKFPSFDDITAIALPCRCGRGAKEAAIRADMIKLSPATAYLVRPDPLYTEHRFRWHTGASHINVPKKVVLESIDLFPEHNGKRRCAGICRTVSSYRYLFGAHASDRCCHHYDSRDRSLLFTPPMHHPACPARRHRPRRETSEHRGLRITLDRCLVHVLNVLFKYVGVDVAS